MALQDKLNEARSRIAVYLTENQTSLGDKLSRAEGAANNQTNDRYQPQLANARRRAEEAIAKLAQPPSS
jgi:hypothetical protein